MTLWTSLRHLRFLLPTRRTADVVRPPDDRHPPVVATRDIDEEARLPRLAAVDVARGLALVAMAAYHGSWDLANVRLVDWGVATDPLWRGFAMTVAASFLFLAGVSLQLAHRTGFDAERFVLRLVRIAAAAALVSIATYVVFPDTWVFFGILHLMVVGSLIAAPLRRLHPVLLLVVAVGVLVLPRFVESPALDGLPFAILGLSKTVPNSNDFVPLFPWLAPLLVGLAAGRPIAAVAGAAWSPHRRLGRGLALLGRWSLVFYLVHQPILFGLATGLEAVLPVNPAVERNLFVRDCVAECQRFEPNGTMCGQFCGCVAESIDGTSVWQSRTIDPSDDGLISTAASTCRHAGSDFDEGQPDQDGSGSDDDD
jgi:uncharacterized membrane protein